MPRTHKDEAPVLVDSPLIQGRYAELDDYTVSFETFPQAADGVPAFRGLPGDRCQCPHWGVVLSGQLTGEETYHAGDAYYAPPGHTPAVAAGTETIDFSPTRLLQETMAVVGANMAADGRCPMSAPEATARDLAGQMITFMETGAPPEGLFTPDIFCAHLSLGRLDAAGWRHSAVSCYERIGARWWRDRLAGPPDGATREAAVTMHFHQNDAGWLIGRDGATAVLPDVKGLHYVRYLLQRPGQEVGAADLAAAAAGHPGVTVSHGDADVIDAQALSAYRARLAEIDAELGEAESWADGARSGRLRLEREALLDEIGAATGLGGRRHQFGSAHERARIAVRKAIVSALDRIEQHDSSLARQLRDSVRTGGACRYHTDPARPVVWILDR